MSPSTALLSACGCGEKFMSITIGQWCVHIFKRVHWWIQVLIDLWWTMFIQQFVIYSLQSMQLTKWLPLIASAIQFQFQEWLEKVGLMVNIFWPFDFTDKRSLCWHGWIVEIFNVLIPKKIRTRLLPPPPLPNIVRIAMNIDIYGRSLTPVMLTTGYIIL